MRVYGTPHVGRTIVFEGNFECARCYAFLDDYLRRLDVQLYRTRYIYFNSSKRSSFGAHKDQNEHIFVLAKLAANAYLVLFQRPNEDSQEL